MVLSQHSDHLSANNIYRFQSAYQSGHNTETALLNIVNALLLSLDEGHVSLLALLDRSAAFDAIDHSILLHRLSHDFGIHGTALEWFSSYLTNRTQNVSIHSNISEPAPIVFGVPPGPVLFVLYTLLFPLSLKNTMSFTTHTLMIHSSRNLHHLLRSPPLHVEVHHHR